MSGESQSTKVRLMADRGTVWGKWKHKCKFGETSGRKYSSAAAFVPWTCQRLCERFTLLSCFILCEAFFFVYGLISSAAGAFSGHAMKQQWCMFCVVAKPFMREGGGCCSALCELRDARASVINMALFNTLDFVYPANTYAERFANSV